MPLRPFDRNGEGRILETGRNDRGQFVSKVQIQEAALKLIDRQAKANEKARIAVEKANAKYAEQKKIQGRLFADYRKHFAKQQKDLQKASARREKMRDKEYAKRVKGLRQVEKIQQRGRKSEISEMRRQYRMQTQNMRRQMADYRRLAREKVRAARAGGGSRFGGGLGLGVGLGIGGGIAGLAYGAVSRTKNLVNEQIKSALSLGPDIMQRVRKQAPEGLAPSHALRMLGAVAETGAPARFGMDDKMLGVLLKTRQDLAGFGDIADDLLADVVKSFGAETDKMRQFFAVAQAQGMRSAAQMFSTPENVGEMTSLVNALQMREMQGQGTLDPLLEASLKVKQSFAELDAAIDKVILQLAQEFGPQLVKIVEDLAGIVGKIDVANLDLKKIAMMIGGAYLGMKALSFGGGALARGGGRLAWGGAKLAGRGAGALLANPVGAGVAIGTAAAIGIDEFGYNPFGNDKQRRAGNYGYGAISWYKHSKDVQAEQGAKGKALAEQYAAQRDNAKTEIDRLRAERGRVTSEVSAVPSAWGGGYSDENQKTVDRLGRQYRALTEQIQKLKAEQEKATAEANKQPSLWERVKSGAATAADAVGKVAEKMKQANAAMQEKKAQDRLAEMQKRAAEMGQLKISAEVQTTETALARQEMELARISPFGMMAALPEMRALNAALDKEIESLVAVLQSIDTSTKEGVIESNRIKGQILGLRKEQKENSMQTRQAMLDSVAASAFGAGRFSKILIDQNKNLGIGMNKGMVTTDNPLLGSISGNAGTKLPRYIQDMLPSDNPLRVFDALRATMPKMPTMPQAPTMAQPIPQQLPRVSNRPKVNIASAAGAGDDLRRAADKIDRMEDEVRQAPSHPGGRGLAESVPFQG